MDASSQSPSRFDDDSASHEPVLPDELLLPLLADLEVRLRPVLGDMPRAKFNALVRDIAEVKLRWASKDHAL